MNHLIKSAILLFAAALGLEAETYVQWNLQNVEAFRSTGVPMPPGMFDAVVVFAAENPSLGALAATGFRVRVEFVDGAIVEMLAPVEWPVCRCAGVRVPFPKGTPLASPRRIQVTPVVVMSSAPVKEVIP